MRVFRVSAIFLREKKTLTPTLSRRERGKKMPDSYFE